MAMGWHLSMFGDVRLTESNGRVVPLSRQQLALLSVLAVSKMPTRAEVIALLWPEANPKRAQQSLSQVVYALNRACDQLVGRPSRSCLSLNRMRLTSDLDHFEKLLRQDMREQAKSMLDPPFLRTLADYPSDTFDDWRQAVIYKLETESRTSGSDARPGHNAALPTHAPQIPRAWFIGREAEIDLFRRTWSSASQGAIRLLVVAGESGVGKSHFCKRAQRLVALNGGQSVVTHCSTFARSEQYAIAERLCSVGGVEQTGVGVDRAYTRRFERICGRPTAVFIEDCHWIDEASASWIETLVRVADDWPLLIVFTINTDYKDERDKLVQRIASSGAGATWMSLRPLAPQEAELLIQNEEANAGHAISAVHRREVLDTAAGLPLFVVELTREAILREREPESEATVAAPLHTQTIDSVLRRRLQQLDENARRIAVALAVAGRMDTFSLSKIAACSCDECGQALEVLEHSDLIVSADGAVELKHELLRRAASKLVGPMERSDYHQRAAIVLLDNGPVPDARVAFHFHAAGLVNEARKHAILAAEAAERDGALAASLGHLQLAEMASVEQADRLDIRVRKARILCISREFEQASTVLEAVEPMLWRYDYRLGIDLLELIRTLSLLESGRTSSSLALGRLKALIERMRRFEEDVVLPQAVAYLLTAAHDAGNAVVVRWLIREIASGAMLGKGPSHVHASILAANAEAVYGETRMAHFLLDRADQGGAQVDPRVSVRYHLVRGIVHIVEGELHRAREELEVALRKSTATGSLGDRALVLTNLAVVHLEAGEVDAAASVIQRAKGFATAHERLALLANEAAWCLQSRRYDLLVGVVTELEYANITLRVGWADLVCETFRVHWYLHHGYTKRAEEISNYLAEALSSERPDVTDRSYSEMAIARAWTAVGLGDRALDRLRRILACLPQAQWASRLRLQAELADLLSATNPAESRRLKHEIRTVARRNGAYAHLLS